MLEQEGSVMDESAQRGVREGVGLGWDSTLELCGVRHRDVARWMWIIGSGVEAMISGGRGVVRTWSWDWSEVGGVMRIYESGGGSI